MNPESTRNFEATGPGEPELDAPVRTESDAAANVETRIFARAEVRASAPEPRPSFSVVEPAARTRLFPARVSLPPDVRFTAGGTEILNAPVVSEAPRAPDSTTQHFSVEQLLSRRAPVPTEVLDEPLEVPIEPRRFWLRLSMLLLLAASAALFLFKPSHPSDAAPASAPPGVSAKPSAQPELREPTALPASSPSPVAAIDPRLTLQRVAADVVAEGRYDEALGLYRRLAANEPGTPAYTEIVHILEQRLSTLHEKR